MKLPAKQTKQTKQSHEVAKAEILKTQWTNHIKGNNKFLKPGARTCKEAFGENLWTRQKEELDGLAAIVDKIVFVALMLCVLFAFVIIPLWFS